MALMPEDLNQSLARAVADARAKSGLSVTALAAASGVSRAMISRVERAEVQPTASLLGRLSGALGMTLSELIASAEQAGDRLSRASEQPVWTDPTTGYSRRSVSGASDSPLEIVEVQLPAGARIGYPADAYRFLEQLVWVLDGRVDITEGDVVHELAAGDCLRFGAPAPTVFANPTTAPNRYAVVITKRAQNT